MVTLIVLLQLIVVLTMIFIGARVGGIGMGIYGMVGVFILVFVFGVRPGNIPIDVMLIIASVITATAALQAAGGHGTFWTYLRASGYLCNDGQQRNAYRQVCAEPFVSTLRLHHHLCQYWHWLLDHIIPLLKAIKLCQNRNSEKSPTC